MKCDDAISRAYIEPIIEELENIYVNADEYILNLLADIKNAPLVTPSKRKGGWLAREDFIYALKTCEYTIHNGQTMYEESELIKRFDEIAEMRGGTE